MQAGALWWMDTFSVRLCTHTHTCFKCRGSASGTCTDQMALPASRAKNSVPEKAVLVWHTYIYTVCKVLISSVLWWLHPSVCVGMPQPYFTIVFIATYAHPPGCEYTYSYTFGSWHWLSASPHRKRCIEHFQHLMETHTHYLSAVHTCSRHSRPSLHIPDSLNAMAA